MRPRVTGPAGDESAAMLVMLVSLGWLSVDHAVPVIACYPGCLALCSSLARGDEFEDRVRQDDLDG